MSLYIMMAPIEVLVQDPRPLGLPEILPVMFQMSQSAMLHAGGLPVREEALMGPVGLATILEVRIPRPPYAEWASGKERTCLSHWAPVWTERVPPRSQAV